MFFLKEPNDFTISTFITGQRDLPFSYSAVGATNGTPPHDFAIDHNRMQLGRGMVVFQRAVSALKHWQQFDLGWVSIVPNGEPLEVGATVAVKAHAFGTWSLNATRIVYLINEASPLERFGFAYGTLPDHVESGEERFTVEFHKQDESVWYDILAFSKPQHRLVKMSYPLARMLQKRFARDSMKRMKRLVSQRNLQ
jgi:uncharacterized protein (UPF0548 family)